jgi:hypothetical protein
METGVIRMNGNEKLVENGNEKILKKINKVLVATHDMDEWTIYNRKLWEMWNESTDDQLIFGPVRGEENESGHWIVRIYYNKHGYWLIKTWVAHFGYSWDGGKVYYLGSNLVGGDRNE